MTGRSGRRFRPQPGPQQQFWQEPRRDVVYPGMGARNHDPFGDIYQQVLEANQKMRQRTGLPRVPTVAVTTDEIYQLLKNDPEVQQLIAHSGAKSIEEGGLGIPLQHYPSLDEAKAACYNLRDQGETPVLLVNAGLGFANFGDFYDGTSEL